MKVSQQFGRHTRREMNSIEATQVEGRLQEGGELLKATGWEQCRLTEETESWELGAEPTQW